MLFECMGICVLSPAHESDMRGYLDYVLIVNYLFNSFCLHSATVYQIRRPYRGSFGGFFETALGGFVDHVIYRDYIVNRRFFIYCGLACSPCSTGRAHNGVLGSAGLAVHHRKSFVGANNVTHIMKEG